MARASMWRSELTRSELPDAPFYAISTDQTNYDVDRKAPMFVLRSRDNGVTWEDFAASAASYRAYYVVGPRTFRAADGIIGMFSRRTSSSQNGWSIYYFHAPAY